jgi:hypothetical protein
MFFNHLDVGVDIENKQTKLEISHIKKLKIESQFF